MLISGAPRLLLAMSKDRIIDFLDVFQVLGAEKEWGDGWSGLALSTGDLFSA